MDVIAKLTDAASMFWQALDERERRIVVYLGAYVLVTLAIGLRSMSNERRETRLRQEIVTELRGHGAAVSG